MDPIASIILTLTGELTRPALTVEQAAQRSVDLVASLLAAGARLTIRDDRACDIVRAQNAGHQDLPLAHLHTVPIPLQPGAGSAESGIIELSRPPDASPFSAAEAALLEVIAAQLGLALGGLLARTALAATAGELTLQTVHALVRAAEMRDRYTAGHSARVARYAVALATEAGLEATEIENLRIAALLHDVGKVGISDLVLNKPGSLTAEEWAHIREHPAMGCQIVQGVASLAPAMPLIMHHHERFDGAGYPSGLAGERIPYAARILAVADAFEALTATRAYRQGRSVADALQVLAAGAGRQWDAAIVARWQSIVGRLVA
ncbi:MAG TPA: HD-GYP domain-containing protein [Anaerolineae bacterium]|nr:HD-GYP domain-containing protein [Anaerolineae bacterium]HOQ98890.1 HD-GYP domain-containing protein [Anaerolineae bacterium]HPL29969.1 HD-GYP domain-containing protein [Anaerolineae bacterium]